MTWTVAPAVKAGLSQATKLWPNRSRIHDGTIGDGAHSTRASDHNPAADGYVYAFDLTHDPASGCDAHALVRAAAARRDPRIKYLISQGRIWSALRAAEGWRTYTGANAHDKHAHVSVNASHRDDISPWWTPAQEDDMTADQDARLKRIEAMLTALVAPRRADRKDTDPGHISLGDVLNDDND